MIHRIDYTPKFSWGKQILCDYVDYWTASLNDSIIYDSRYDDKINKRVFRIDLEQLKLKNSDTLKISHITNTPCPTCEYNLLLADSDKNKILLLKNRKKAEFKLTRSDLQVQTELIDVFYFRADKQNLIKILELKKKAQSPTKPIR